MRVFGDRLIGRALSLSCVLLILCAISGCAVRLPETTVEKSQFSFYKDYVFVKVMHHAFDNDPVFKKDVSLAIYNEWTDYVVASSHGKKLDSLARVIAGSIKPSPVEDYEGAKPTFQKTLDYYNSKAFDREIRRILKSPKVPL